MRRPWALFVTAAVSGCTCPREQPAPAPTTATVPDAETGELAHDLELRRTALLAFGNSTPLPVSDDFTEDVPAVRPALERAAAQRPNQPLRARVARDVPFGQLTRLMQAALANRVLQWDLQVEDVAGVVRVVTVKAPSPTPRGECWARAWVGPDARVLLGIDLGNDASANGMTGILVLPKDEHVQGQRAVEALHRADPVCEKGQLRIYSQASARVGGAFDLAHAIATASTKPKINDVVFAVPSIGALDSVVEVVK